MYASDDALLPQHKRLAQGKPVNQPIPQSGPKTPA
jgi:hypothetical protein